MKGKNLIILGAGAIGGFIGGNIFVLSKVVKSERMMKAIKDIVTDRITDVLFEDNRRSAHKSYKVSYRDYYQERHSHYRVDQCVFQTRGEAEEVLNNLLKLVKDYGLVRVSDYYDLCSIASCAEDANYGWVEYSVSHMSVIRYRDGYTIEIPKPLNLKGENHA